MAAPSFDDIDKHIQALDPHTFTPAKGVAAGVMPANFCAAYKAVKPILQGILLIPFLKPSWKAALTGFIAVMDGICP